MKKSYVVPKPPKIYIFLPIWIDRCPYRPPARNPSLLQFWFLYSATMSFGPISLCHPPKYMTLIGVEITEYAYNLKTF